ARARAGGSGTREDVRPTRAPGACAWATARAASSGVGISAGSTKVRWATVGSFGHGRIRHDRDDPVAVRSTDPFTSATVVAPCAERPVPGRVHSLGDC